MHKRNTSQNPVAPCKPDRCAGGRTSSNPIGRRRHRRHIDEDRSLRPLLRTGYNGTTSTRIVDGVAPGTTARSRTPPTEAVGCRIEGADAPQCVQTLIADPNLSR